MATLLAMIKRVAARIGEIGGTVLALIAVYEAVFADRVAPVLTGGFSLCESPLADHHLPRSALFAFLRENADSVVFLDIWVTPVEARGDARDCGEAFAVSLGDHGLRASGSQADLPEGSGDAMPELVIEYDAFTTPQTARLTGQQGEENIFGVRGLVYVEAGEVDAGFQAFALGAAPYDAAMLTRRDCTAAYAGAEGTMARLGAYLFHCIKQ